jgi:hypothetical protein
VASDPFRLPTAVRTVSTMTASRASMPLPYWNRLNLTW